MHPTKKIGFIAAVGAALSAPFAALAFGDTGINASASRAGLSTAANQAPIVAGTAIKTALGLVGIVFLILMVYAGYIWMIARGDESKSEKAKSTIINSVIGIVIVVAAYAITSFLVTAFNPDATGDATAPAADQSSGAPNLGSPDATAPDAGGATDTTAACGGCPLCTWGCKGGTELPCSCADTPGNST